MSDLQWIFKYVPFRAAPLRAQKILIFGGPSSGRTSISTLIAESLQMVHISASNLIKEHLNNEKNPIEASRLKEVLQHANMIPDDFVNTAMKERLSKIDCRSMGFCLEGYPRTEAQNSFMKNVLRLKPDIIFVLDCPDHVIHSRLKLYRQDPITGRMYSQTEIKQINQANLEHRLKDLDNESEEIIKTR